MFDMDAGAMTATVLLLSAGTVYGYLVYLGSYLRNLAKGPFVGLYERGIQHPSMLFIPYPEITGMETEDLKRIRVVLKVRNWPWGRRSAYSLPFDFLGEEGMRELEERVHGAGSPE